MFSFLKKPRQIAKGFQGGLEKYNIPSFQTEVVLKKIASRLKKKNISDCQLNDRQSKPAPHRDHENTIPKSMLTLVAVNPVWPDCFCIIFCGEFVMFNTKSHFFGRVMYNFQYKLNTAIYSWIF
jgi:hypothetical protein